MANLSDLPIDELIRLGRDLGLDVAEDAAEGEVLRRVRERQTLIEQTDRDVLLELIAWTRIPVKRSTPSDLLVREIVSVHRMHFGSLSREARYTLARLRNVEVDEDDDAETLERKLRRAEGVGGWIGRKMRGLLAGSVGKLYDGGGGDDGPYEFVPEGKPVPRRLNQEIKRKGLVGGIGSTVKSAADHYVAEKLDEIEVRIDGKLDEIDKRLDEWRDREVANRLKIIRITLIISVIIAGVSLLYAWLHGLVTGG